MLRKHFFPHKAKLLICHSLLQEDLIQALLPTSKLSTNLYYGSTTADIMTAQHPPKQLSSAAVSSAVTASARNGGKVRNRCRRWTALFCSTLGIVCILLAYVICGAIVFASLEGDASYQQGKIFLITFTSFVLICVKQSVLPDSNIDFLIDHFVFFVLTFENDSIQSKKSKFEIAALFSLPYR